MTAAASSSSPPGAGKQEEDPAEGAAAAPEAEDPARAQVSEPNEEENLNHTRWWLVASAFPMIAGTLGPVASAFSICALSRPWRQYMPPGTDFESATYVSDPPWLTAVNAVQLAMAVVSNVFLLLNMARRVKFTIAQPITIVGWYISSFCLIALCATASGPLKQGLDNPVKDYVLSQAFYYGIWAAILYFVVASFMTATFWGASTGHFSKSFALTSSQRTLMLQTILFLTYLLLGALIFSTIEGWNYLDGVYWANVTLFTVGFGDFAPTRSLARALLLPYALIGIVSLGLVIASIRSMILDRARRRVAIRMEEKTRRRLVRTLTKTGNDTILRPMSGGDEDASLSPHVTNEYERRKVEFELMRSIQDRALRRRQWMDLSASFGTLIVLWLVGALVFWMTEKDYQENWTYFIAFYLCFVSLTTIGYGDRVPITNAGKAFFVFWSLLALPTMTVLISHAENTVVKFVKEMTIKLGAVTILPRDKIIAQMEKEHLKQYNSHQTPGLRLDAGGLVRWRSRSHSRSKHVSPDGRAHGTDDPDAEPGTLRTRRRRAARHTHLRSVATRLRHAAQIQGQHLHQHQNRPLDTLPTGHEFQLLLVAEIRAVTQHLREATPRRYSFEEWAWFLWLLGEDERDAHTHRKARPDEKRTHHGVAEQPRKLHADGTLHSAQPFQWSWVGSRSPLTADQEESEWVLDRLTFRLQKALENDADTEEAAAAAAKRCLAPDTELQIRRS
ncbi:potassium channel, putative [Cordyceps militaris CM01]|uniref:Potassium channel, putative n=1 Tax=Cordyceps militaris (strain CM01) TaxID=983644 RepID=G3J3N8_CORMM|nr:potassium channel, putative [Cordyceps militaris CM01]EGX95714.1 potassium channel, putative [Cordyceps militaris CM01]